MRQRRGQIAGLHNFGRTCFLNTLLQALAACPQFIAWLQLHGASDKKSLIGSLLNTLEGRCHSLSIQLQNSTRVVTLWRNVVSTSVPPLD